MKRQKFINYLMVTMAMMTMCMFAACGDDKDDDLPDGYYKTTEGVHRIDVSFSGDASGWEGATAFVATYGDGSHGFVKLYENGKLLSNDGTFMGEDLRSYSVETEEKCDQMSVTVTLVHDVSVSVSPVTVTLKSFINGQPKKTKAVEFTARDSRRTIVFNSELDADVY